MRIEIGMGEIVGVRLTEEGKRIMQAFNGWGRKEKDGMYTFQLGDLIWIFGSSAPPGTPSPFVNNKIVFLTGADVIEAKWG